MHVVRGSSACARGLRAIHVIGLATLAVVVAATALLASGVADAQVRANRLNEDTCLAEEITSFDDVIMTAVATHDGGDGDVYQALCDDEDCWGFSINRGAAANALTTGLTPGDYTYYVCAWNGSVRRVVANLSGGAALFRHAGAQGRDGASGGDGVSIVSIDSPDVPPALARFSARLDRIGRR